ncbi:MAG: hypothetical protein ABEJ73_12350 [Haloplanus sp.]
MVSKPNQPSDETTQVTVKISDAKKQRLNEIAFELSEPGERVTASDVIRESINDYLDKFEQRPAECTPRERGALNSVDGGETA